MSKFRPSRSFIRTCVSVNIHHGLHLKGQVHYSQTIRTTVMKFIFGIENLHIMYSNYKDMFWPWSLTFVFAMELFSFQWGLPIFSERLVFKTAFQMQNLLFPYSWPSCHKNLLSSSFFPFSGLLLLSVCWGLSYRLAADVLCTGIWFLHSNCTKNDSQQFRRSQCFQTATTLTLDYSASA